MEEFKIGTYIRKQRELLQLSQEELCEGYCSVSTLSRIENNQQDPSRKLTMDLLERLGLPKDKFTVLWTQQDITVGALMRSIRNDIARYRQTRKEERPLLQTQLRKKMAELEAATPNDRSIQQFLLANQAILGSPEGPYGKEKRLSMQLEAIRLTCPKFDPDDFQRGRYSMEEARIINQAANTYSEIGDKKRAINVYRQLLSYIEKNFKDLAGYASLFCLVAQNYAIDLGTEKYHSDAIEVAEQGRKVCLEHGNYQFLPGFLAIQAECFCCLGEKAQGKKRYIQAYYIYEAFEDECNREIMRKEIKERLGFDFSD